MPATPRQITFLNSLLAERNLGDIPMALRDQIGLVSSGATDVRQTSAILDRVIAVPRSNVRPAGTPSHPGAEDIPTPSYKTRAGRMLQAGGIVATVTCPNGQHVTITISSRQRHGRGWRNCGPSDEGVRTNIQVLGRKVGWVNVEDGRWKLTLMRSVSVTVKDAIRVLFGYAAGNVDETGNMGAYRVQEANRCGRCRRDLTDPVSIDRGIGPECFGRTTGSHHARVDANTTATPAPRDTTPRAPRISAQTIREAQAFTEASRSVQQAAQRATAGMSNVADAFRAVEATPVGDPAVDAEITAARDLIVEALDAYEGGVTAGMNALRVFDKLVQQAARS